MDLQGELAITTLQNQYSSELHSKQLLLYPQRSVILTPHQRYLFLQQMDIIKEKHTQSIFRIITPSPNECIYKTFLNDHSVIIADDRTVEDPEK